MDSRETSKRSIEPLDESSRSDEESSEVRTGTATAAPWEPDSTPARICQAAERLFAERGYRESTIRDVTHAAGVNVAAINYHFGSKEGLLRALVTQRIQVINVERRRLLDLARRAAGDRPPTPDSICRAFVEPVFRALHHDSHFPTLMTRLLVDDLQELLGPVFQEHFMALFDEFATVLEQAVPHLSRAAIRTRMAFTIGSLHFSLIPRGPLSVIHEDGPAPLDLDTLVEELVAFATAGFTKDSGTDG